MSTMHFPENRSISWDGVLLVWIASACGAAIVIVYLGMLAVNAIVVAVTNMSGLAAMLNDAESLIAYNWLTLGLIFVLAVWGKLRLRKEEKYPYI